MDQGLIVLPYHQAINCTIFRTYAKWAEYLYRRSVRSSDTPGDKFTQQRDEILTKNHLKTISDDPAMTAFFIVFHLLCPFTFG